MAKAIGTGMRVIRAQDITVLRDRLGCPFIITEGYAKMFAEIHSVNVFGFCGFGSAVFSSMNSEKL